MELLENLKTRTGHICGLITFLLVALLGGPRLPSVVPLFPLLLRLPIPHSRLSVAGSRLWPQVRLHVSGQLFHLPRATKPPLGQLCASRSPWTLTAGFRFSSNTVDSQQAWFPMSFFRYEQERKFSQGSGKTSLPPLARRVFSRLKESHQRLRDEAPEQVTHARESPAAVTGWAEAAEADQPRPHWK